MFIEDKRSLKKIHNAKGHMFTDFMKQKAKQQNNTNDFL